MGLEQQISWKCLSDAYACVAIKQRLGVKRKCISKEKENQILLQRATEEKPFPSLMPSIVSSWALLDAEERADLARMECLQSDSLLSGALFCIPHSEDGIMRFLMRKACFY